MKHPRPSNLPTVLLLALAYFTTGWLGLLLPAFGSHITLLWLPTGIAVAALLRGGFGCWPGISLGAVAVNFAVGTPWPVVLAIAVGNTLGPVLAARTLQRTGFHPAFDRKRDILLLAMAALLGMLVSASMGVAILSLTGMLPAGRVAAWLIWWAGDAMGVIAAAPLVFTLRREEGRVILRRGAEFSIWLGLTGVVTWGVFVLNRGSDGQAWALAFVPLPLVAWATLRFGAAGTSLALIALSVGAAYGTATGRGPFYRANPIEGTVVLWIYMATSAVLGWLITALDLARVQATGIQRLFEQAISDVSLGVLLAGLDRRITYANHGFTRLTGYPEEAMLGQSCALLQGPETDAETVAKLEAAVHGDGFFDGEILNYRKDGTSFWNALLISPVRDPRGVKTGFLAILRDVTQRKQAELALRESEDRFRRLIEHAPEAVMLLDVADGRFVQVNPAAERLFKLPAAELCRRGPEEMSPPTQPDGRASSEKARELISQALEGETPVFEWTHRDAAGRDIPCEVRLLRLEIGGRVVLRGSTTDISARKQAEEALRDSEVRYRRLFEANPHPMWVYDLASLRFLAVNAAAIAHYGYRREEFLAMTIKDIRPPEDIPALLANVGSVEAGLDHAGIWRHRKRDGSRIEVEISSHVLDFDGHRAEVVLAHDITDRRRAEACSAGERAVLEMLAADAPLLDVLDRLARTHEQIFPGMLCSVLLLDAAGKHLRHGVAPSLPEAFCRAVDGLEIGPTAGSCGTAAFTRRTTVVADIANDPLWQDFRDLALAHELRACWSVPLISSRGRMLGTLALYYRDPARPRPEEISAIERGAHFASLAIERHELQRSVQESQVRLQTLVGNLPGMAYRCQNDPNWTMTYVSEGCEAVTSYRRDELENNRAITYAGLVHPDDRDWLWAKSQTSLAAHTPCQNDYRIIDRHGRERWVSERASGAYAEDGALLAIDGFIQDVTAARQAKLEREQLDRKVQETQKLESLGVLAGGIAHDFNNLLTSILGNASIATLELPPDSSVQDCLEQITEASLRAADLCKQMLAYSGRGRFIVQQLDLGELVEQTAQMLQISISKKAILRYRLEKGLPAIEVDATQLRQVIMNLVINASEAIGDKSGVVSLSTGLTRVDRHYLHGTHMDPDLPEGDYVFLEVSDSGCGMSAETQAKIFDPFFTTKFTGRGLGLAAVLGIVRGHKGAMKVDSELGRGTTFTLLFPATASTSESPKAPAGAVPQWHGEGTVLVVDDEETMRSTVARMMRLIGLDPVLASDGREAIEIFRANPGRFAFVLLDLTMPHMDGEQTFGELRRLRPEVRVVLMSGFNAQEALVRFPAKGLASFLQKPFTIDGLRTVIRDVLG